MTIDGNFTADHVLLKNPGPDLWLSEGGGMMASRIRIDAFMATATTKLTVRSVRVGNPETLMHVNIERTLRKHLPRDRTSDAHFKGL